MGSFIFAGRGDEVDGGKLVITAGWEVGARVAGFMGEFWDVMLVDCCDVLLVFVGIVFFLLWFIVGVFERDRSSGWAGVNIVDGRLKESCAGLTVMSWQGRVGDFSMFALGLPRR